MFEKFTKHLVVSPEPLKEHLWFRLRIPFASPNSLVIGTGPYNFFKTISLNSTFEIADKIIE